MSPSVNICIKCSFLRLYLLFYYRLGLLSSRHNETQEVSSVHNSHTLLPSICTENFKPLRGGWGPKIPKNGTWRCPLITKGSIAPPPQTTLFGQLTPNLTQWVALETLATVTSLCKSVQGFRFCGGSNSVAVNTALHHRALGDNVLCKTRTDNIITGILLVSGTSLCLWRMRVLSITQPCEGADVFFMRLR